MDKITSNLIRNLKENGYYEDLTNSQYKCFLQILVKTLNPYIFINTFSICSNKTIKFYKNYYLNSIYEKLNDFIGNKFKDIVIVNITDSDKFLIFLNQNGIIWGSNRVFNKKDKEELIDKKTNNKTYFIIRLKDNCKLYYGKYLGKDESCLFKETRVVLNENEFYDYYNRIRKLIYDKFIEYEILNRS